MYPKDIVLGLDLYDIFLCIGIVACILAFDKLSTHYPIRGKLQTLALYDGIISIICGYGSAVLFQAVYNIAKTGRFEITKNTGATFYGGLIGGALVFLLVYFTVGHFYFKDKYHVRTFFSLASCAAPAIVVAHACGRIGCLFAGCCHGKVTDAWYGIKMYGDYGYVKYVPVQLYEALFLFALFAILAIRAYKRCSYNLPVYMTVYGVWRYIIEFIRGDERGGIFTKAFSPSQFIAIIMIVGGVSMFIFERYYINKHKSEIEADALAIFEKRTPKNDVTEESNTSEGDCE